MIKVNITSDIQLNNYIHHYLSISDPAIYEPVIGSGFPLVYPNAPKVGQNVRLECWAHGRYVC